MIAASHCRTDAAVTSNGRIEHDQTRRKRPQGTDSRSLGSPETLGPQRPDPSKKQVRQIADSIETFGFTNPVLIDQDGSILAGHGRVAAARLLGMTEVPCLQLEHMSEVQKRAYVLADNKPALNAGWDEDLLAEELETLMKIDLGFDIGVTGFSIPEIDALIEDQEPEEPGDPADDLPPADADVDARCQPGDVWRLGRHRLVCGDAERIICGPDDAATGVAAE